MKIVFDTALDGRSWPGPLGQAEFAFGEPWVGPMGLLKLLETRLGLGGQFAAPLQRACRLAAQLGDSSGHWRESYEVDPLGTCRRLLHDRDELRLWGWTGQPVSPRLLELHAATQQCEAGVPDRLDAIADALATRATGIRTLISYTVIDHLPPLWRRVFQALRDAGIPIDELPLTPAPAMGDLAGARAPGFTPAGDGRLCLLRRHGPLDVADELAASLAACDNLDGVVIIGADSLLDHALYRLGLPRVGGHAGPPASARLLALVLEAAFHPMEIADLHALLAADPGPIPRSLAAALIGAIRQCPGRRTREWEDALARGLSHIGDEKREDVERRVTGLLLPVCRHDEPLPVAALRERLGVLDAWARGRAAFVPSLLELSRQVRTLLEAVDLIGAKSFSWHELRRLCDGLGEPNWAWQPAEAGLAHVPHPGAILAPARAVIWWNFSRESAPRPKRLLLTNVEREGLRSAGIEPPDPSLAMAVEVDAWSRPLMQAREALVLACPLTDAHGESSQPHPLWDDVTAALEDHRDAAKLKYAHVVHLAPAKVHAVGHRSLVVPAQHTSIDSPIELREVESPSSVERLLGCSLAWALKYHGRLESGLSGGPPQPGPLVFGSLAHMLLDQVLERAVSSADEAATLAETLFEEQYADLCEDLALPQHQAARATLRRVVVESARELGRLQTKHGVRVARTEVEGETIAAGIPLKGRLDLVWDDPNVVLDLKWGKSAQVERLRSGTAIQLAAYAAMRESEGRPSETAYFVLLNQDLLAEPGGRLAGDARMEGSHGTADIWSATLATLQSCRDALASGLLEAPGADGQDVRSAFSPSGLQVPPPCKYCEFAGLCGRGGAQ